MHLRAITVCAFCMPGSTASITVKPILSRQQQGVAFAVRW
jgi:hypothetical protein